MTPEPSPEAHRSTAGARAVALWPYAVVVALGLAVLTPQLGAFGLWDPWEPKYAESAREMVERGSYVVPYYRHEVRLTKPILVYWGILAGTAVFGMNEVGARAVGVGLAILSMVGVCYAVTLLRGRRAGLISACVLGTTPYFYFLARQAMPDVYLLTSSGCAMVFLALGLFGPERRRDLHFAISYVGFALALLAKGPMIVGVVYGMTLAVYAVARIEFGRLLSAAHRRATFLAAAGIGAGGALFLVALPTAFFYGTSSEWWGYSAEKRQAAAAFRAELAELVRGWRLAEVALLGATVAALFLLERARRSGRFGPRTAAAPVAVVVVSAAALFAGPATRILIASLLVTVLAAAWIAWVFHRYVRLPGVWPRVEATLPRIGRQLLLFGLVLLVVAGPWHIAILVEQGAGYFTDFILKHNVERAAEKINQTGASDFYLDILTFGFFPWSAFLVAAVAWLVNWRERDPFRRNGPEAFLLISLAVTYAAFAIPATKFPHYLSPATVPVAVLVGITLDRMLASRSASATMAWIVTAGLYLLPMRDLLADEGIRRLVGTFSMKRWVPASMEPGLLFRVLLISIAILLATSIFLRARALVAGMVLAAAVLGSYNVAVFIPKLSVHKTMRTMCEVWRVHGRPRGAPIAFEGSMKHGIFFYTDFEIDVLRGEVSLIRFLDPGRPAFAIIEKAEFPEVRERMQRAYPGADVYLLEDSHFQYALIGNHELDRSHPPSAGS